uniref:Kinetochore protein SPC25 n=1 Tax=Aegilops tauschii TaxID=37682 RepID=R7WCD1_AEGTA
MHSTSFRLYVDLELTSGVSKQCLDKPSLSLSSFDGRGSPSEMDMAKARQISLFLCWIKLSLCPSRFFHAGGEMEKRLSLSLTERWAHGETAKENCLNPGRGKTENTPKNRKKRDGVGVSHFNNLQQTAESSSGSSALLLARSPHRRRLALLAGGPSSSPAARIRRQILRVAEDLDGLKKRLRDLGADLGQALSVKLVMESKCEKLRESISASAATSEQLGDLVTNQRNRSERHAAVISDVLEAAEAFEAKNEEDVTLMKDMEKAICWYQKRLGFQPVVEGEGVKFIFDKVDLQSPEKEFSFSLKFDSDRYTPVLQCSPPVEDSEELMKDLNLTNDLVKFVRIIRQRFQAAALNGDLPVSPTVCSDASAIPISSPVIKSVDSRSKNDRDRSNSQNMRPQDDIACYLKFLVGIRCKNQVGVPWFIFDFLKRELH